MTVPPQWGGPPPLPGPAPGAAPGRPPQAPPPAPDMAPGGVPLRPLGVGDILSGAVALVRRDPVPVLIFAAVLATGFRIGLRLISDLYTPYIQARALPIGQPVTPAQQQAYLSSAGSLLGVELVAILSLLIYMIVFWNFFAGMLAHPIGSALLGGRPGLRESLRGSRAGVVLVITLTELATFAGVWVLGGAIVIGLSAAGLAPLAVLFGVAGSAGALLLMFLLMIRWSAATSAAVLERLGPWAAITRSWRLTKGRYWRTFGILSLSGLVSLIATDLLIVPYQVAYYLVRQLAGPSAFIGAAHLAWQVASMAVGIFATFAIVPLIASAMILSYANLRFRKEGLDLVLQQASASPSRPPAQDGVISLWR